METKGKYLQDAWCVLFKHSEGWTVVGIEFRKEMAVNEMNRQKIQLPHFKYKIAPCKIWVAQHYLK